MYTVRTHSQTISTSDHKSLYDIAVAAIQQENQTTNGIYPFAICEAFGSPLFVVTYSKETGGYHIY